MNDKEQKQEIRQRLLKRRSEMEEVTYLYKSNAICARLQEMSVFQKAATVHCYVSLNDRREVNTQPLIKKMIGADKKVIVPITHTQSGLLSHRRLQSFGDLKPNKWGVLEPCRGENVLVEELDLVIVPMVGGDRKKNRIGYGKGFYDRFLQQVNCPTVGLLYDNCLLNKIPTEPFDVSLSMLITEDKLI